MNWKLYGWHELEPDDSHRSFYGKAHTKTVDDGTIYLCSYHTIVMSRTPDGLCHRHWGGWSATTGRHVRAFAGGEWNKKKWDAAPVEPKRHNFI